MNGAVPRIRMRGVRKAFGEKQVLDGVDLDIAGGDVAGGDRRFGYRQVGAAEMHPGAAGGRLPEASRSTGATWRRCRPRRAGQDARAHRDAVPRRRVVRQPAGLGKCRPSACSRAGAPVANRGPRDGGGLPGPGRAWRRVWARCRRRNCRAACRSASPWRGRSPRSPTSCSSTSRPPASIPIMGAVIDGHDRRLRQAAGQHRAGDHPRHGEREAHR